MPRNFINWSCKLTLFLRERAAGRGQPPVKSEVQVKAQSRKQADSGFGCKCSRISRGTPEARSHLCECRASFLIIFATGGVPHAGSRQITLWEFPCTLFVAFLLLLLIFFSFSRLSFHFANGLLCYSKAFKIKDLRFILKNHTTQHDQKNKLNSFA